MQKLGINLLLFLLIIFPSYHFYLTIEDNFKINQWAKYHHIINYSIYNFDFLLKKTPFKVHSRNSWFYKLEGISDDKAFNEAYFNKSVDKLNVTFWVYVDSNGYSYFLEQRPDYYNLISYESMY